MFETLLLALLVPAAPPAFTSTVDCPRQEVCRFVPDFVVRDENGRDLPVKAGFWGPYVARDGQLSLFPGEIVLVRLQADAAGRLTPVFVRTGQPDANAPAREAAALENLERVGDAAAEGASGFTGPEPEIVPDMLRFTFKQLPGKEDTVLVVENGYSRRLDYKALMVSTEGRARPTTVCEVPAGLLSFEHWPEAMISIELSGFRLLPDDPDVDLADLPCD